MALKTLAGFVGVVEACEGRPVDYVQQGEAYSISLLVNCNARDNQWPCACVCVCVAARRPQRAV